MTEKLNLHAPKSVRPILPWLTLLVLRHADMTASAIAMAKGEIVKRELSKMLMPDHPLYTEALEAQKAYHQAEADGIVGIELERMGLMAEHRYPSVADYQLQTRSEPAEKGQ